MSDDELLDELWDVPEDDFPQEILRVADEMNDLANRAREEDRDVVVDASLKIHAQQLYALALAYPSVDEEDVPLNFLEERDE